MFHVERNWERDIQAALEAGWKWHTLVSMENPDDKIQILVPPHGHPLSELTARWEKFDDTNRRIPHWLPRTENN